MDEPLHTMQMDYILRKNLPDTFKGVYSSDHLPETEHFELPWCMVLNSVCSHLQSGHWLALYVDVQGTGHFFTIHMRQNQLK